MDNILVSVILTTYNRPDYLSRALNSVVNQTYKNLEILVIDGKGLKETKDFVRKFKSKDDRIVHWVQQQNVEKISMYGDVQTARNFGLSRSTGKYVAMLDDDDYWRPDKIEQQLFYAEVNDAALTSCQMKIHGDTHIDKPKVTPTYEDLLKSFNMSCTSSYFLNRKILNHIGGFDESLRSMHEYDIALKLAKLGYMIYVVQQPLMTMTRNNAKDRKFYYIKIAEVFDLYRLYANDMITYLGVKDLAFNIIKSSLLISLFLLGFIIKERVWDIIFKLKNWYQEKSNA